MLGVKPRLTLRSVYQSSLLQRIARAMQTNRTNVCNNHQQSTLITISQPHVSYPLFLHFTPVQFQTFTFHPPFSGQVGCVANATDGLPNAHIPGRLGTKKLVPSKQVRYYRWRDMFGTKFFNVEVALNPAFEIF